MVKNFNDIKALAKNSGKKIMVVPAAEDKVSIMATYKGIKEGFISAILIGNLDKINGIMNELKIDSSLFTLHSASSFEESAQIAVQMVREGKAHFILKGSLPTGTLMKAVLDSEKGLRTGRLLSDILFVQDPSRENKIIGMTDGGLNILPDLKQKKEILENAVDAFRKLGCDKPKVAVLCAIEVINPTMPATVDAGELKKMNQEGLIKDCIVDGPLALDIAVSKEAAEKKGVKSEVAGDVDILLVPNIEAGNLLGKSFTYYSKVPVGHVIMGAKAPILIPSRNESDEDKLNSIALGVICA